MGAQGFAMLVHLLQSSAQMEHVGGGCAREGGCEAGGECERGRVWGVGERTVETVEDKRVAVLSGSLPVGCNSTPGAASTVLGSPLALAPFSPWS